MDEPLVAGADDSAEASAFGDLAVGDIAIAPKLSAIERSATKVEAGARTRRRRARRASRRMAIYTLLYFAAPDCRRNVVE